MIIPADNADMTTFLIIIGIGVAFGVLAVRFGVDSRHDGRCRPNWR
ncbi:unannotated protein [freshwater metagenome]|uniref:Unannotated protein n=1 Tax=freshwater metagenome TaxID=449393 RepID=A0A6J6PXA0_9ZZZZ